MRDIRELPNSLTWAEGGAMTFMAQLVWILLGFLLGTFVGRDIVSAGRTWLVGVLILVLTVVMNMGVISLWGGSSDNVVTGLILGLLAEVIHRKRSLK